MWLWLPAVSQMHSWRIGVSWHSNSTRIRTSFNTSVFPLIIWKNLCESLMLYFQVAQRATEYEIKKVLVTFYRVSSELFCLFKQEAYVCQVTWEKQHVWVGENCVHEAEMLLSDNSWPQASSRERSDVMLGCVNGNETEEIWGFAFLYASVLWQYHYWNNSLYSRIGMLGETWKHW